MLITPKYGDDVMSENCKYSDEDAGESFKDNISKTGRVGVVGGEAKEAGIM